MNGWALSTPTHRHSADQQLSCQLFSAATVPMHFMLCWNHCSSWKSLYLTPSFSFPFLVYTGHWCNQYRCLQRPGHAQTWMAFFPFLPLFLQTLTVLTWLFNWPQMHRGDSLTVDGYSLSFMPDRENSGFGVGLTSYFGSSVEITYTQRIWPGYWG